MTLKSLCCVWTLLLLVQHALCFSLEKHCARRCLYGRGGIICKCNAIHFTGKRSYDPKHSYTNPLSNHDHRHGFLLSILNRPEFLKSLAASSLGEQEDLEETGDTKSIQLVDNHESAADSEGLEKNDNNNNAMDVGDTPSQPEVFFKSDKVFGRVGDQQREFPLRRYNGLTRDLAHLVQNAWQRLAPQTNIDVPADSFSSAQIEPTAEVYDNQDNDLLSGVESEEDNDLLSNPQAKIRPRLSLVQALEGLIKRLPTLIHRYKSDSANDLDSVGTHADDIRNLIQPGEDLSDVNEKRKLAWNRLMKYLAHALSLKERHRTKRDKRGAQQPDAEVAKEH